MEFLQLKITNFLAVGEASPISLKGRGLVLIQGVNNDDSSATSNGVGKSSVADALCWALYGRTARDESGDAVVNTTAKKNCSVTVTIKDGESIYDITRYRKHKEFKNQTVVKALGADISLGTEKETQALIDEIMGCTYEVFVAAIYAGQEAMPDLPKMTDKQLKLLIEEASGVERLEKAYEIARARLMTAKSEHSATTDKIGSNLSMLENAKLDHAKKELDAENFDKGRVERANVLKMNAEAHKSTLVRFLTRLKGIDADALRKRSEALASTLAGHSDMVKKRSELSRVSSAAERVLAGCQNELDNLTKQVQKLKDQFDNAETEVKKACPSCGKPGDEHDLEAYRAHVKAKLVETVGNVKGAKANVADAQAKFEAAHLELVEYEKTIPDVSEVSREQEEINAKLREHASIKLDATREKAEMDRQIELSEAAMTEANPHASAVSVLSARIVDIEKTIESLKKSAEQQEQKVDVAQSVVSVFSPAGVRAHILDTVTPFLNDRTADYLSAMSDGNINAIWTTLSSTAKGDLKEKFTIEVSNDKGGGSFKLLSGGEKRKVRLATMLALQDLVSSRASKQINLWIGDEIDDAMDNAGLERLMAILERKARERGTVLVISHNDLNCWIDQAITVTKSGGLSTIADSGVSA